MFRILVDCRTPLLQAFVGQVMGTTMRIRQRLLCPTVANSVAWKPPTLACVYRVVEYIFGLAMNMAPYVHGLSPLVTKHTKPRQAVGKRRSVESGLSPLYDALHQADSVSAASTMPQFPSLSGISVMRQRVGLRHSQRVQHFAAVAERWHAHITEGVGLNGLNLKELSPAAGYDNFSPL